MSGGRGGVTNHPPTPSPSIARFWLYVPVVGGALWSLSSYWSLSPGCPCPHYLMVLFHAVSIQRLSCIPAWPCHFRSVWSIKTPAHSFFAAGNNNATVGALYLLNIGFICSTSSLEFHTQVVFSCMKKSNFCILSSHSW